MTQKNEIIEWVGRGNTNPAVLGSMLDSLESGGSSGPAGNVVNITNNSSGTPIIDAYDGVLITAEGVASTNAHPQTSIPSGNSKMFLFNQRGQGKGDETLFFISLPIKAEDDLYSVVVNNTPVAYDDRSTRYRFHQESATGPITGQIYNVVITDKESQEGQIGQK